MKSSHTFNIRLIVDNRVKFIKHIRYIRVYRTDKMSILHEWYYAPFHYYNTHDPEVR